MATSKDWQVIQATTLYKLLKLKKKSKNGVIDVSDLDEAIGEIQASMSESEIAQVEAQIEKFIK